MKLALIGCGNMGTALIGGIISSGTLKAPNVVVFDVDVQKSNDVKTSFEVNSALTAAEAVSSSDVVLLAVKPNAVGKVLEGVKSELDQESKTLISIAAGLPVSFYRNTLKKTKIVRVMPNTPALVGEGMSALYFDGDFSDGEKEEILSLFRSCGRAIVLSKESWMDAVTGLSGSGPAYVFNFINALADGGVLEGLPRSDARLLAAQTVFGAAKLAIEALEKGDHFVELKDRVTSPGGTTAEGLFALEQGSFSADVISAVRAATEKSKKLGGK